LRYRAFQRVARPGPLTRTLLVFLSLSLLPW
jgi:hypothetical protein